MKRRNFLATVGVLSVSPSAFAQRPAIPFIGLLTSGSPNERKHLIEAFRAGLKEAGYTDGKDVAIEYRWAEGRLERLPALAKELVDRKVAVIAATGDSRSGLAAKAATRTIPIVFTGPDDPVKIGLVSSLSRPGGNLTGIANIGIVLEAKRLEILHSLIPAASRIAYLVDPLAPTSDAMTRSVQVAADAARIQISIISAKNEEELEPAFAALKESKAMALLVGSSAMFVARRDRVVALAGRYAIPTVYGFREFAVAGGLMSYGADLRDIYRQVGVYCGRILKGEKPANLPVLQASKFELVLNLKTVKQLGIRVSRDFLARVDEVIQ